MASIAQKSYSTLFISSRNDDEFLEDSSAGGNEGSNEEWANANLIPFFLDDQNDDNHNKDNDDNDDSDDDNNNDEKSAPMIVSFRIMNEKCPICYETFDGGFNSNNNNNKEAQDRSPAAVMEDQLLEDAENGQANSSVGKLMVGIPIPIISTAVPIDVHDKRLLFTLQHTPCKHTYCCSCLLEYVRTKVVAEGVTKIKCCCTDTASNTYRHHQSPAEICGMNIDDNDIKNLLFGTKGTIPPPPVISTTTNSCIVANIKVWEKYQQRKFDEKYGNWCRRCPKCDFANFFLFSSDITTTNGTTPNAALLNPIEPTIHCDQCGEEYCYFHSNAHSSSSSSQYHDMTCTEYEDFLISQTNEIETSIYKQRHTKICPSCGINIEKISGCDHVHCTVCNYHFYWNPPTLTTITNTNAEEENDRHHHQQQHQRQHQNPHNPHNHTHYHRNRNRHLLRDEISHQFQQIPNILRMLDEVCGWLFTSICVFSIAIGTGYCWLVKYPESIILAILFCSSLIMSVPMIGFFIFSITGIACICIESVFRLFFYPVFICLRELYYKYLY